MLKKTLHKFAKVSISLITSIVVAVVAVNIVSAATYYVSEYSTAYSDGSTRFDTLNPCPTGWTCKNSNAKRSYLTVGYIGTWKSTSAGTTKKRMDWYAFIPNDTAGANFGAVKYTMSNGDPTPELYKVNVNQTNWKGQYVYIGYLSYGYNKSMLFANVNDCVAGYLCDSSMPIYFDQAYFIY
jgi:hypothetical protein